MDLIYKTENPYEFERVSQKKTVRIRRRTGWSRVDPDVFGAKLTHLRGCLGYSQPEMARFIDNRCAHLFSVSTRKYQRWERGKSLKRFLKPENLAILADVLCVPLSYLTCTQESPSCAWEEESPLFHPAKILGDVTTRDVALQVYRVEIFYKAEKDIRGVIATSATAARGTVMEHFPGAKILTVEEVVQKPGVVI